MSNQFLIKSGNLLIKIYFRIYHYIKFVFSDGSASKRSNFIVKNFLAFVFWLYTGLGFIAISYIHLTVIFQGSIYLTMDALRPYELILSLGISAIFITKGVLHIKRIFDEG
jgi:hypothetical protein